MINYAEFKFNKKIYDFFYFSLFSQKAYSCLVEHQCSAENSLGNAAVINNKNSTADATYYHTTNNFPIWKPIII